MTGTTDKSKKNATWSSVCRMGAILCLMGLSIPNAANAQLPPPVVSPNWTETALQQFAQALDDSDYRIRQRAEDLLSEGRIETLQSLLTHKPASAEFLMRARRVWEQITRSILLDSDINQLQQLRNLIETELISDPYHPYAESMLKLEEEWSGEIQWAASRWALEQGGDLNFRSKPLRIAGTSLAPEQRVPTAIFLSADWHGSTDNLRPLFDMFTAVEQLGPERYPIYLIDGAPFRERDIARMVEVDGLIDLNTRGRSRLGITFTPNVYGESGLMVNSVVHLSTAAAAGIVAKDMIIALNGTDITGPESLIESLKQYDVGDVVTVSVLRNHSNLEQPQKLDLKVRLQGWTGEDRSPDPFD